MGTAYSTNCVTSKNEFKWDDANLTFLHGRLDVTILSAQDLPDTDKFLFNVFGQDLTDPYVEAFLGNARIFKSRYIKNELNPSWDESFKLLVCHHATSLVFKIKDKEQIGEAHVAMTSIRAKDLATGRLIDGYFDMVYKDRIQGKLQLKVQFIPKSKLNGKLCEEIPGSYFPMRKNNRLTLYQDAETLPSPRFNNVTYYDDSQYIPTRAWYDLYKAIASSQKFIYITGWSIYPHISLVRGDESIEKNSHLGNLLKQKASEGVRVLILLWNEKMSTERHINGLMRTHDVETQKFFEGTSVECVLVQRAKYDSLLSYEFVSANYAHHQKTIVLDMAVDDNKIDKRRVVAFVGGLDITDGRYDRTGEYPLYSTLHTLHKNDFYSYIVPDVTQNIGPREPWHDCHSKVEGPTALDIKKNFEERWYKQVQNKTTQLYHIKEDDFVMDSDEDYGGFSIPDHEGGPWNLQVFRSLSSDSAIFDIDKHAVMHTKSGKMVENTIMKCMVRQIRHSEKFIYMENQYFLGSAFAWYKDQTTESQHLIPREIAQRIVEKISQKQPFKVYIVIPMFPEGDPSTLSVQEILYWQYRTIETMYRRVAQAIKKFKPSTKELGMHPTDYLSFYCLGKRESPEECPSHELDDPPSGSPAEIVRSKLRHPIYLHSKMSIFDDEYVLIGSANINQRSLDGARDSEIAVGGYQPDISETTNNWLANKTKKGAVQTYRMALWANHFGKVSTEFMDPSSHECLEKVRDLTSNYWMKYTADNPVHCDTHILPYPIQVDELGNVSSLNEPWNCFPDTKASVLGQKSGLLPGKLTT